MKAINAKEFSEMDKLSEKGEPFIFIIDFLKQNILLFTEDELNKKKRYLDSFSELQKLYSRNLSKQKNTSAVLPGNI